MQNGLCFMHAPIVLQHYLVQMNSAEAVPMLDMADYWRRHVSDDATTPEFMRRVSRHALYELIWKDNGGDSVVFLEQILVQRPTPVFKQLGSDGKNWRAGLELYGPLLVSTVEIEQAFMDGNTVSFLGEVSTHERGMHAMVLVGHRKEGDEDRFLLQNWWESKVCLFFDAVCSLTMFQ